WAPRTGRSAAGDVFLRAFGVHRRWLRWIFNSPRRSFKQRVLVDRQRAMKNVALDGTTALQLDADGADSALHPATDRDVLRNDTALDLCAIANKKIGAPHLAFDSAETLRWTIAFDVTDDRHSGADTRGPSRFCRPLGLIMRLHRHDFGRALI